MENTNQKLEWTVANLKKHCRNYYNSLSYEKKLKVVREFANRDWFETVKKDFIAGGLLDEDFFNLTLPILDPANLKELDEDLFHEKHLHLSLIPEISHDDEKLRSRQRLILDRIWNNMFNTITRPGDKIMKDSNEKLEWTINNLKEHCNDYFNTLDLKKIENLTNQIISTDWIEGLKNDFKEAELLDENFINKNLYDEKDLFDKQGLDEKFLDEKFRNKESYDENLFNKKHIAEEELHHKQRLILNKIWKKAYAPYQTETND